MLNLTKKKIVDIAERAGATFGAAFAATYAPVVLGAQGLSDLVDLSMLDRSATAGIAAAVVVVLGLVGVRVGDKDEASLLRHKVSK